jgi:CBS domain-containing protein
MLRFADSRHGANPLRQSIDDERSAQTFVATVMTRDLQTVRPETPLAEAAQQLVSHKFGCLPVTTSDGTLVGIVTEHDFLKTLVKLLQPDAA